MNQGRPKIQIPLSQLDVILEVVAVLLLLFVWIYPAMQYAELPETIPTHFNAKGEADDWGNKLFIWFVPVITTLTYALIIGLNRFPHLHNYMVNITEENAFKNYQLSTRILRIANLFVLIIMTLAITEMINKALGGSLNLIGIPFLIGTLVFPAIGIIIAFRYQNKINS